MSLCALASPYLATWVLLRLLGRKAAEGVLRTVAPVGEKDRFVAHALRIVSPFVTPMTERVAVKG